MKHIIFALLLAAISQSSAFAEEKAGMWIGGMGGQSKNDSLKPTTFGGTIGMKASSYGFEAMYLTGSKTVGVSKLSISQIIGRFDIFLGGKIFYIGPQVGHATLKAAASAGGITVAISSSGIVYGGGAGLNIPLGPMSLGADVSYMTGSMDGSSESIMSYVGTLKFWL